MIGWSRALAAAFGAPACALVVCAALAKALPFDEAWAFACGAHLLVPLWVILTCTLPLAQSGWRAWMYCGTPTLLAAVVLVLSMRSA